MTNVDLYPACRMCCGHIPACLVCCSHILECLVCCSHILECRVCVCCSHIQKCLSTHAKFQYQPYSLRWLLNLEMGNSVLQHGSFENGTLRRVGKERLDKSVSARGARFSTRLLITWNPIERITALENINLPADSPTGRYGPHTFKFCEITPFTLTCVIVEIFNS